MQRFNVFQLIIFIVIAIIFLPLVIIGGCFFIIYMWINKKKIENTIRGEHNINNNSYDNHKNNNTGRTIDQEEDS